MAIEIKSQTLDEMAEDRNITQRLKAQTIDADDALQNDVWKYCKKLASCTHAPVALSDYKRMAPFALNKPLVTAVFTVLQNCDVPIKSVPVGFDVIGYFYSIALISISDENRVAHMKFLMRLAEKFINEDNRFIPVLHRNMARLCKEYPDLLPIRQMLDGHTA